MNYVTCVCPSVNFSLNLIESVYVCLRGLEISSMKEELLVWSLQWNELPVSLWHSREENVLPPRTSRITLSKEIIWREAFILCDWGPLLNTRALTYQFPISSCVYSSPVLMYVNLRGVRPVLIVSLSECNWGVIQGFIFWLTYVKIRALTLQTLNRFLLSSIPWFGYKLYVNWFVGSTPRREDYTHVEVKGVAIT